MDGVLNNLDVQVVSDVMNQPGTYDAYADLNHDGIVNQSDLTLIQSACQCSTLPPPTIPGLVSHWKFDGNANDSVGTNHGILVNGPVFATGKFGQALIFDGVDDYVFVLDSTSLSITGDISISFWFKTTDSVGRFLDKRSGGNNSYEAILTQNNVHFSIDTGKDTSAASPLSYNDDTWHHFAGTWDGSQIILYIDGNQVSSTAQSGTMSDTLDNLIIGNSTSLNAPFAGLLDDIRIYNKALTPLEIQSLQ
jgi:hypothetical protein